MVDTERTKTELLEDIFKDGQGDNEITEQDMRDFVVTADIVNTRFSTGLITGGEVTISADPTMIDIAAGTGFYADNTTTPLDPKRLKVSWTDFIGVFIPVGAQPFTIVGMNLSSGTAGFVLQATDFTSEQRRDIIPLAIALHTDLATVDSIGPEYGLSFDVQHTLTDMAMAVGPINIAKGNVYSANGANLNLDKSAGSTFNIGANYENEKKSPNIPTNVALIAPFFFYTYRDGSGGFTADSATNVIDPENLDTNTGAPVGVQNSTKFTIQRIWLFAQTNFTVLQYSQNQYQLLADAEAAVNTENFVFNPQFETALFRGWLIVEKGTTDLAAAVAGGTAKFIAAGMFGDILRS